MQSIFNDLKRGHYFLQLDLASGFHHLGIVEKDEHNIAFGNYDGVPL